MLDSVKVLFCGGRDDAPFFRVSAVRGKHREDVGIVEYSGTPSGAYVFHICATERVELNAESAKKEMELMLSGPDRLLFRDALKSAVERGDVDLLRPDNRSLAHTLGLRPCYDEA